MDLRYGYFEVIFGLDTLDLICWIQIVVFQLGSLLAHLLFIGLFDSITLFWMSILGIFCSPSPKTPVIEQQTKCWIQDDMTDFTHFWHMPPQKKTCLSIFFSFHQQQECDKAFTVPHLRLLEISIYVSFPHLSPTLGHQTSLTLVPGDLKWHLPKKNCRNSQPMWATVKNPPVTFHYTGWLMGIQIVRYNPTNRQTAGLAQLRPAPIGPSLWWAFDVNGTSRPGSL